MFKTGGREKRNREDLEAVSVNDEAAVASSSSSPSAAAAAKKYSTRGTYGLKRCHDADDAVADIVFVHGLTGNRETTWTDKSSGVFWPLHLLKHDVPKTRILSFGYDADVVHFWATASQNRIRNHAGNLVNELVQLRERSDTEDRPVLFVTHSLGGLVFEDAMLASRNSAERHLQRLHESTLGVCFLGTPHCGSTLANWAKILGNMTKVVQRPNTSLLEVLQPDSEVLAVIQADFHNMVRKRVDEGLQPLNITCFFEELPVKLIGEIVPKHSAILPAYNAIGIHNNHMDLAKFTSEEDPGYLAVSTELLRWVRNIQRGLANGQEHGGGARYDHQNGRQRTPAHTPLALDWPSQQQSLASAPPNSREQSFAGSIVTGEVNNYGNGKIVNGANFYGNISF